MCIFFVTMRFNFNYILESKSICKIRYHIKSGTRLVHLGLPHCLASIISNEPSHHYEYFIAIIVCKFFPSLTPQRFMLSHVHLPIHVQLSATYIVQSVLYVCTFIKFYSINVNHCQAKPLSIIKIMRKRTIIMQTTTTNTTK